MTVQFGGKVGVGGGIKRSVRERRVGRRREEERHLSIPDSAISWLSWKQEGRGWEVHTSPLPWAWGSHTGPLSSHRSLNFNWVVLKAMCAQEGRSARMEGYRAHMSQLNLTP